MDNQQLCIFTREQQQVFLTSQLGDGYIGISNSNSVYYTTNCKYEEYIDYKISLLGEMFKRKFHQKENGYNKTPIWIMRSKSNKYLQCIKDMSIIDIVNNLDELGIALWFYDDGSLHKEKLFYNLNTHKFTKEIQEKMFISFFHKFNIYPVLRIDKKKDGRTFYYLSIGKYNGAYEISKILQKYYVDCYSYKIWSSETIQKWSKLQEKLKSTNIDISKLSHRKLSIMLTKISI
jgi:hypothetical protein